MDNYAEKSAIIIGLTGIVSNYIPDYLRKDVLPLVAVALGIGIELVSLAEAGYTVPFVLTAISKGIALGGVSTGLYKVGMKGAEKASGQKQV